MTHLMAEGETLDKELTRAFLASRDLKLLNGNLELDILVRRISGESGFDVSGATPLRILSESTCPWSHSPLATVYYLRVEFMEGPNRGKMGWVCRSAIDDPRTGSL
jgi:hypothetical protein